MNQKRPGQANPGELKGRVAVVTGAGSGLGRSIAIGLARAGASVCLVDIDEEAAAQTSRLITDELAAARVGVIACDVTDQKSVDGAFDRVMEDFRRLDVLINAAGIAPAGALVDLPVEKWRRALEVNLTGYFLMAQAAARIMIRQGTGGCIVNISSKSGLEPSKDNTPYNATKAGELHMARGWALELGEYGIRVNCVCPGGTATRMMTDIGHAQGRKDLMRPEEIAEIALFLASPQSSAITSTAIDAPGMSKPPFH